jgi:hypothetical protein
VYVVYAHPSRESFTQVVLRAFLKSLAKSGHTYDVGARTTSTIDFGRALVLCLAGHTVEHLETTGVAASIRKIIINDRL